MSNIKEQVEITFKNKTNNQEIKINVKLNKYDSMKLNIDFGKEGANYQKGLHVALVNMFTDELLKQ